MYSNKISFCNTLKKKVFFFVNLNLMLIAITLWSEQIKTKIKTSILAFSKKKVDKISVISLEFSKKN